MENRTWIIVGALALIVIGASPIVLAQEKSEPSYLDEIMKMVTGMQTRVDQLAQKAEQQDKTLEEMEAHTETIRGRAAYALNWGKYVDGRLTSWMESDKADIAELFFRVEALENGSPVEPKPTQKTSHVNQLQDDMAGNENGWNPDDKTSVFSIIDSHALDTSVITTTLNWGDTQCYVRGMFEIDDKTRGFSLVCDGPVSEGASLNYLIANPNE